MKKKLILAASLAALFTTQAVVTPSVYASAQTEVVTQAETQATSKNNYFREVPEELLAKGSFDYGGLHYTTDSYGYLTANQATNPSEVKELILYYRFGKGTLTYLESINWSLYTNLENVVAVGTSMSFCKDILGSLPSGTNLYVTAFDFGEALATMPFKNIYGYFVYDSYNYNASCSEFTNNLSTSCVEKVYLNPFVQEYRPQVFNTFNYKAPVNKNDVGIQLSVCEEFPYPEEVFYPIASWDPSSPIFGTTGHWEYLETSIASIMSRFTYVVDSWSDKVLDLNVTNLRKPVSFKDSPKFNKVYMPSNENYNFHYLQADELIIKSYAGNEYFMISAFKNIKTLRFIESYSNLKIFPSDTVPEDSILEKIYIPTASEDRYTILTTTATTSPLVETYDYEDFVAPMNTFKSEDGNIYAVRESNYTVEEMENAIELLKTLGISVKAGDIIDDIMNKYEFPIHDTSDLTPKYTLRDFDTILVPKNLDATKVLESFKFIMVLNHGQMCDAEGTTISCDTTNYQVGYNALLPITVTFPDKKTITKEITIKAMPTEENLAYILDKDDVYIITNLTGEDTKSIASLMNPMMEHHLMETSVEYEESPILNSFDGGYFAGNSYSATLSSGKIKLVCSDVPLTEEQTPEHPDEPSKENDGYVIKEITKIYTPETIDGSRLLSQMRDFMCTKDGKIYDDFYFGIGTNIGRTNKENYTFSAFSKLSEAYTYDKKISVEIIQSDYKMGYVLFDDGDIAVLFNCQDHYTKEQIETAIKAFLTSQKRNAESVSIPTDSYSSTKTYEGSYDNGKIYIVNSGVNLSFSTSIQPVDQTNVKEGYVALNRVIYTKGYTLEEVIYALGKNILLKDGKLVTDKYEVEYITQENSKYATATFKIDDKEVLKKSFYFEEIESDYSYIFARAYEFDYGYLIIEKQSKAPDYKLNDVMIDFISRFRTLMSPFETKVTIDFTKTGTVDVDGIYCVGNGSYYSYEYNVEVCTLKDKINKSDVTVDGKKAATSKVENVFNDFKDNFENNKTFKTMSIILGTILGLVLIYVGYRIIRKIHKWLKK